MHRSITTVLAVVAPEIRVRYWVKEVPETGLSLLCSLSPLDEWERQYRAKYLIGRYLDWNGDEAFTVGDGTVRSAKQLLRHEVMKAQQGVFTLTGFMQRVGALIAALVLLTVLW